MDDEEINPSLMRIHDVQHVITKLENKIKKYNDSIKRSSRIGNISSGISLSVASIATVLGFVSLGVGAIPLSALVIVVGSVCGISTVINKISQKSYRKINKNV